MNNVFFYNNFLFYRHTFVNYHYTDNRAGVPLNYLAYMIKGYSKIVSADKTIYVNEGDVFYIPKNLGYQSYWYGDNIDFLSFGFSDLNINENVKFDLQTIPYDKSVFEKVISIPTVGTSIDCDALCAFYGAMSAVIPYLKYATFEKKELIVEKAKSYIYQNPDCTIPDVAQHCLVSEPYLYTLFNKATNSTPNDFRQKILCQKGIELLTTTDKTIEEISGVLNFSSSSYFRKVLKKHTGRTPREIRKNGAF